MMVYVPFMSHKLTAECLRKNELMKGCLDAKTMLQSIKAVRDGKEETSTYTHPATQMWLGAMGTFGRLLYVMLEETKDRRNIPAFNRGPYYDIAEWAAQQPDNLMVPDWWGGPTHNAHQRQLLHEDWKHYSPWFPELMDTDATSEVIFGYSLDGNREFKDRAMTIPPSWLDGMPPQVRDSGMVTAVQKALDDQRQAFAARQPGLFHSKEQERMIMAEAALTAARQNYDDLIRFSGSAHEIKTAKEMVARIEKELYEAKAAESRLYQNAFMPDGSLPDVRVGATAYEMKLRADAQRNAHRPKHGPDRKMKWKDL